MDFITILTIFSTLIYGLKAESTYSVLAPKVIRPNSKYNVIIAIDKIGTESTVYCTLTKQNSQESTSVIQTKVFSPAKKFDMISFDIGNRFTQGQYNLTITSNGGVNIKESVKDIELNYKQYIILIQSDKAIYKPGQNVLFRTLVLDETLRPVNQNEIDDLRLFIIDPLDNKLREFVLDITANNKVFGVNKFNYTNGITNDMSFNLHDEARNGKWKIQAAIHGQIQNYTFLVDDYVLPLANVTIHLPEFIEMESPILDYEIGALYTFGKPVKGYMEVIIEKIKDCRKFSKVNHTIHQTIDNQFKDKLDLRNTKLLFSDCNELRYNFTVNVYDNITKSIYSNYEEFSVINTDIKAELEDKRTKYRPGHTIINEVILTSKNGGVIPKHKIETSITCESSYRTSKSNQSLPGVISAKQIYDGKIICEVPTENDYAQLTFTVILTRSDSKRITLLQQIYTFAEKCDNVYIQIKRQSLNNELSVGQNLELVVNSNVNIENLIFYVVIRGSIFSSDKIIFDQARQTQIINLKIVREMVPEALIGVYMKSPNSNAIVSSSLHISVKGIFHNQVKIAVKNHDYLDAGDLAKFSISAEKNSELFILAVDESVLALKQGNDITADRVLKEFLSNPIYDKQSDGFLQTGMNLLTDGQLECVIFYLDEDTDGDELVAQRGRKVRKDFRETWIWARTYLHEGQDTINLKDNVPDSITTWKITAFSLNQESGLGITTVPGYVRVFRPFFLKLNLPYSIKRYEDTDINISVFNYLNETVVAKVRVYLNNTMDSQYIKLNSCETDIEIKSNEIQNIVCSITSNRVGKYPILAEVVGKTVLSHQKIQPDAELRELLVKFEGMPQQIRQDVFFDLTEENANQITHKLPSLLINATNIVNGSEKLYLSGTTDIIMSTWQDQFNKNKKDIQFDFSQPSGCCQQRIAYYFPKVFWLEYLNITHKLKANDRDNAAKSIQHAIDLLCFHVPDDGSFVFYENQRYDNWNKVNTDELAPSYLWQTAYTLKMLWKAKDYVKFDQNIIFRAKNWLRVHNHNGMYIEVYNSPIFVTGTNAYLTAYTHIIMHEAGELDHVTDDWLGSTFSQSSNPLDIISTCYALHIIKHINKEKCYEKVEKMMKSDENYNNYWVDSNGNPDIHLTSYGLMILSERKLYSKALNTFKFLISKQNTRVDWSDYNKVGHFRQMRDSYIQAILTEALTKFMAIVPHYNPEVENVFIDFKTNSKKSQIHLRADTEVVQVVQGDPSAENIEITAQGYGRVVATILYQYYVKNIIGGKINVNFTKQIRNENYIILTICTSHHESEPINNTIVEMDLPSGYNFDHSKEFKLSKIINHLEVENGGTHINIYLAQIHRDEFCFNIPVIESYKVKNRQPAPIKVYPYYDHSKLSVTELD